MKKSCVAFRPSALSTYNDKKCYFPHKYDDEQLYLALASLISFNARYLSYSRSEQRSC